MRPTPAVDRDSAPWWEAVTRHELAFQRCDRCGAWRWPPRVSCNRCGSFAWAWQPASGRGEVVSWIVNHHAFSRDLAVPYVVVLVRVAEQADILMPGGWAGPPAGSGLRVGLAVEAVYEDVDDVDEGATLVQWRPEH
jgi:uncharacterized OB-fold protein